jgi:hypothetical protein
LSKPGKLIVLVTGVPGSRKTALARDLSMALRRPMSAANMIENMLAVSLRANGCECPAQLHMASVRVMWSMLGDSPTGAVVEVNGDADKVSEGLSGIGEYRLVEIFCHAPPGPSGRGYQPLGLGPRRRVDLSRPVDTDELVTWILCRASGN